MWMRRILYLLVWLCCGIFFWAYRLWLSWYLLVAVTCLPFFSLLISLPAMLTARAEVLTPHELTVKNPAMVQLHCRSFLPTPLWRCRVEARCPLRGERFAVKPGQFLPTEHCGGIILRFGRLWVYDYMGLFRLPTRRIKDHILILIPYHVPLSEATQPLQNSIPLWRPKRGGGFSENHDLRLYRPGDPIQQIHWKLSGKTGKLILREPMEPIAQKVLLRLKLTGTPEELDRMLGRLLWLGEWLLKRGSPFEIHCLSGHGAHIIPVANLTQLQHGLNELLLCPPLTDNTLEHPAVTAGTYYDIGGGLDV